MNSYSAPHTITDTGIKQLFLFSLLWSAISRTTAVAWSQAILAFQIYSHFTQTIVTVRSWVKKRVNAFVVIHTLKMMAKGI